MELGNVKIGLRVEVKKLGSIKGMFIKKEYLNVRTVGVKGKIAGYVSGHGGDVLWVEHDDGDIGAYVFDEIEKM